MVWSFVPFTRARQERLFRKGLQKIAKRGQAVAWIERADETVDLQAVEWDDEEGCWETEDGRRYYARGSGSRPTEWKGIPVVHIFELNRGVISTEFAVTATAKNNGDIIHVDSEGVPLTAVEERDDGEKVGMRVTDGEQAIADDEIVDLPLDEYDGYAFSLREASEYDPAPVEQTDARQAVENARIAEKGAATDLRTFLLGLGVGVAIVVGFIVVLWLMGQIGGSGSSIPIPAATTAALAGAPAKHHLPTPSNTE